MAAISLTQNAAIELRSLLESKNASPVEKGLRLLVEKGGCAGMQYQMKIDDVAADDEISERDGVRVMVDPESLKWLAGSAVDYHDALNDSGFKIINPQAARSCGCGTSFEPATAANDHGAEPAYDPETMDGVACKESPT